MTRQKLNIGLVDDHRMFRSGVNLLLQAHNFNVVLEAENGQDLIKKIQEQSPEEIPDILLLDLTMPIMDGFEAACWLKEKQPELKFIAFTMRHDGESINRIVKNGARGYISKNIDGEELELAITAVMKGDPWFSSSIMETLMQNIRLGDQENLVHLPYLDDREQRFIQLSCSELTHKEIAEKMGLSVRTIDLYRMNVFEKLGVKSRTGLVLYAVKNKLVTI